MIGKTLLSRTILFIIAVFLFLIILFSMPEPEALIGCAALVILRAGFLIAMIVFCKHFLDKIAKHFWTLLHVQIGQNCNAYGWQRTYQPRAIADII